MTTTVDRTVQPYDEFTGPEIDQDRWDYFTFPLPDGGVRACFEPDAVTDVGDGGVRVTVERFTTSHSVQSMDNVKHLLLSTREFVLAEDGVTEFSGEIAAHGINAVPRDYRYGFVSLVTIDMATGAVYDLCAMSDAVFAIEEQLPFPGVERPYTYVVEEPISRHEVTPDRLYRCRIAFDPADKAIRYYVQDKLYYETRVPALPRSVHIGLGIFSLYPTSATGSHSLVGQGMSATWRNIGATVPAQVPGQ